MDCTTDLYLPGTSDLESVAVHQANVQSFHQQQATNKKTYDIVFPPGLHLCNIYFNDGTPSEPEGALWMHWNRKEKQMVKLDAMGQWK